MKKQICWTVATVLFFCGCTDNYRVRVDETNIALQAPAAGAVFDLNDLGDDYRFGWDPDGGEYALVLSKSPYLLNPYVIEAGSTGSYTADYQALDQQLALFGLKAGESAQLYWSVKPAENLAIASSEIRPLAVRRLVSKLEAPEDRFRLALSYDEPDTPCEFAWDAEGLSETESCELIFSSGPQFEAAKTAVFDANGSRKATLTHEQLQTLIGKLALDPFNLNTVYWNVRIKSDGTWVSLAPATLLLDGMPIYTDPRDGEVYRVVKLIYSDGEEVVWFADNYRGSRFTDSSDLGPDDVRWPSAEELRDAQNGNPVPEDRIAEYQHVYGGHYRFDIRNDIAPEGWHLATNEEFVKLFNEAALADGGVVVLKDPVFYSGGITSTDTHVNAWKMNMTAAGRYLEWGSYIEFNKKYANFHIATLPEHMRGKTNVTLLHDGGSQLWYPEQTLYAPVRFVYGNP